MLPYTSLMRSTCFAFVALIACGNNSAAPPDGGSDANEVDEPYNPDPPLPSWMDEAHVLVNGHDLENDYDCRDTICRHNENTDMIQWNGSYWLVHRTARSQVLGPNSAIHIYNSPDGIGFTQTALVQAPLDPDAGADADVDTDGRDLRDPHFYVVGNQLCIHAITRLPVSSTRDTGVDSISVATCSSDGTSWSALTSIGPETWSFWRVKEYQGVYYSAAYQDGDLSVSLFSSTDGMNWTQGAQVYGVSADTPLETELVFFPSGDLLAIVRTDLTDAVYLASTGPISTRVCWAQPPYSSFDCPQTLDGVRPDGPLAFFWNQRLFVIARKHILTDDLGRKRTALYEIVPAASGDAGALDASAVDGGAESALDMQPLAITEWGELPSAGDTSYAGYAMLDQNRARVSWYSGDIYLDETWATAIFNLTDIWIGTIDFSRVH